MNRHIRKNRLAVHFSRPTLARTVKVESVHMRHSQAFSIFVEEADPTSGETSNQQIEIRVLPDGKIEIFHEDLADVVVKTFASYYAVYPEGA